MKCIACLCLLILPTLARAADADVVYVTDELRLGLYRTEETSGRTIKTLISGARLTVLERSLMSIQVRTEEGDEGWVKTAYIVETEPARARLARIEAAAEETEARLAAAEEALDASRTQAGQLADELAAAERGITELPALRAENATLKEALAEGGLRVPLHWFIGATLVCLFIGALIGYWLLDRRVRSRFGGLRPY
jgi:SH3 domain protein